MNHRPQGWRFGRSGVTKRVAVTFTGMIMATVVAVSGCSGPAQAAPTQVSATAGQLTVTVTVSRASAGVGEADVVVLDRADVPVTDAGVSVSSTMAQMGHSGQVVIGQSVGAGRYRLAGNLFPMPGRWDLRVQVKKEGVTSVATVPIVIT